MTEVGCVVLLLSLFSLDSPVDNPIPALLDVEADFGFCLKDGCDPLKLLQQYYKWETGVEAESIHRFLPATISRTKFKLENDRDQERQQEPVESTGDSKNCVQKRWRHLDDSIR